jgi:hypothetical protein
VAEFIAKSLEGLLGLQGAELIENILEGLLGATGDGVVSKRSGGVTVGYR